ncbi:MAG: SDR family oxidoreductase [Phycisphaeraceae bacterium]|nr:MAG: SDR family oxidoreductase [Phycisphaeraceae bacterium]
MTARTINEQSTIAIFGATGGIGSLLARSLSEDGHTLALASRTEENLSKLADELDADHTALNAAEGDAVDAFLHETRERHGRLDGVVNCIGSVLIKPAHLTSDDEWLDTLTRNLTTSFNIVRSAAKLMQKQQGGSIVLMSSAAARVGLPSHEAIAAAKAGVIGLTLSAAASYASRGVRINCVAPGLVRTNATKAITSSEASLKASTAMHPLGRVGEPEDIVPAIRWLLGPESSWVTGQCIGADGGLGTIRPRGGA